MIPASKIDILFRCDASYEIGFGHLNRCLALADELQGCHRLHSLFAMRSEKQAQILVNKRGFAVHARDPKDLSGYRSWLADLLQQTQAKALVLDSRDRFPTELLREVRRQGVVTATIDDPTVKRLHVDLAFYPPNPGFQDLSWNGFQGRVFAGPEWIILSPQYSAVGNRESKSAPQVLVTMGGSDPFDLTGIAVQSLLDIKPDFSAQFVLGPGFRKEASVLRQLRSLDRNYRIHRSLPDLSRVMEDSDLALVAFGTTAYELAAAGIPAVYLCISEDHRRSASYLESAGAGLIAGTLPDIDPARVARVLENLLHDRRHRFEMSRNARNAVDGHGAVRVGREIAGCISRVTLHVSNGTCRESK